MWAEGEPTAPKREYFKTFSEEYKTDLERLDKKEIPILDFAKKYNLLWGSKNNPKVKATVLNDLTIYKKYKDCENLTNEVEQ